MNKIVVLGGRYLSPYIQHAFESIGYSTTRISSKDIVQFAESSKNWSAQYTIIDAIDPARSTLLNNKLISKIKNIRSLLLESTHILQYCYLSSGLVYKESKELITEMHRTEFNTTYQRLKLESENKVRDSAQKYYCFRLTNVWSEDSAEDTFMGK